MQRLLPLALLAALALSGSRPALAARPRVYAITGATVVAAPGRTIESGVVVIRDGFLEAVGGAGVTVPADAVEIDAKGQWVYPGLVDAWSSLVLEEDTATSARPAGETAPGSRRAAPSAPPAGAVHPIARVRPERRMRDRLVVTGEERLKEIERFRSVGLTTVSLAPRTGIFRGQACAVLLLDDAPASRVILKDAVAQHVAFESGQFGDDYPTSLMGSVATIRQTLLDARRYALWSERYGKDPSGMPRPDPLPAFDALRTMLDGKQRVVFELSDPKDLELADGLAREFGLDAVVAASGHEWEIAERAQASGRWLILPVALPDKPRVEDEGEALDVPLRDLRRYLEFHAGPKKLADAGVPFVFSTHGLKSVSELPRAMKKVLDAGLSFEQALAAWTIHPATLLGIERITGSLDSGKIANVLVTDGPLFAEKTKVKRVFVDGDEYRIEEKAKPKADPSAVVDPRGEWSVVFELGRESPARTWTIGGTPGAYSGTAETRSGTVSFDKIDLAGNALTVVYESGGGRTEATVIVSGESFEGTATVGPREGSIRGTRTKGPEGGER